MTYFNNQKEEKKQLSSRKLTLEQDNKATKQKKHRLLQF